jgi:hypothetical protein
MSTDTQTPLTDAALFNHSEKTRIASLEVVAAVAEVSRRLERDRAELIAALAQFEQLIDRPIAESGSYSYTMANAPTELVSAARTLLARVQS